MFPKNIWRKFLPLAFPFFRRQHWLVHYCCACFSIAQYLKPIFHPSVRIKPSSQIYSSQTIWACVHIWYASCTAIPKRSAYDLDLCQHSPLQILSTQPSADLFQHSPLQIIVNTALGRAISCSSTSKETTVSRWYIDFIFFLNSPVRFLQFQYIKIKINLQNLFLQASILYIFGMVH